VDDLLHLLVFHYVLVISICDFTGHFDMFFDRIDLVKVGLASLVIRLKMQSADKGFV